MRFLYLVFALFTFQAFAGGPIIWGPNGALNLKAGGIQLQSNQFLSNDGPLNYISNPLLENGQTTGFSLGHVTVTSGYPTGTPTFGSGASGNLSLSASNTAPIQGTYSLSVISSAATTVGDLVATSAFTVNAGDQLKTLPFTVYYKVQSGTGSFTGLAASASFGIAVYNVTQGGANWIVPYNVFCQIQSAGIGICSGWFTTTLTDTQYRLVIYNANATSGAITMGYDRWFLGPNSQSAIPAPVIDWVGSVGSGQSVTANVTDIAVTTIKDSNSAWNGTQYLVTTAGDYIFGGVVASSGSSTTVQIYKNGIAVPNNAYFSTQAVANAQGGGSILVPNCKPGDLLSIRSSVSGTISSAYLHVFLLSPTAGGSSGNPIVASYFCSSNCTGTTSAPFNFDSKEIDTANAVTTGASWQFLAPETALYGVGLFAQMTAGVTTEGIIYKSTAGGAFAAYKAFGSTNTAYATYGAATAIQLNAGDAIQLRPSTTVTAAGGALATGTTSSISIWKIANPPGTNTAPVAPTIQKFLSGTAQTYTLPTAPRLPLYIHVRAIGGGGGGAGGNASLNGGAGGNTTFGTSLLTASGGGAGISNASGGAGGSASLGTGPIGIALTGGGGGASTQDATGSAGGVGGNSAFGGGGFGGGGSALSAGGAGSPNTGGGGGGAGGGNGFGGSGGGSGGYVDVNIYSPALTYLYTVGASGTAGGTAGAGGSGIIIVEEYYQ